MIQIEPNRCRSTGLTPLRTRLTVPHGLGFLHRRFGRATGVRDARPPVVDDSRLCRCIAGAGISMNALWSIHRELADGSLIRVLPNYKVDDQTALWLVYPKSNVLTAKVRIFIDFLLEKIGNVPVWAEA